MLELTTYTELEIAHRLGGAYSGRCLHCHGHRYEVEITVTSDKLNEDGMIIDFKKLKEIVKVVLDDKWDHGACFNKNDSLAGVLSQDPHHERLHLIDANPTLEWMVREWASALQMVLSQECPGVILTRLKASETARNTVTWTRPDPPVMSTPEKFLVDEDVHGDKWNDACDESPDAVTYLVTFRRRGDDTPLSLVCSSALKGTALLIELREDVDASHPENIILLGISRIPE